MTRYSIHLDWVGANGRVMPDAPIGYHVADFFEDRGAWMHADYARADDIVAAAAAEYRGTDVDGIGLRLTIWDDAQGICLTRALS